MSRPVQWIQWWADWGCWGSGVPGEQRLGGTSLWTWPRASDPKPSAFRAALAPCIPQGPLRRGCRRNRWGIKVFS